jgi:hypothetical protein
LHRNAELQLGMGEAASFARAVTTLELGIAKSPRHG